MRTIERTNQFKRDYKRVRRGRHRHTIEIDFLGIVTALANDDALAEKHRDHPLNGDWRDFRDCHIKPDLILVYRKVHTDLLQLVRPGSHSELGF